MLKKILLISIFFLFIAKPAFADNQSFDYENSNFDNEVILEPDNSQIYSAKAEESIVTQKTLREKIADIYHLEIAETNKPYFLMSEILTKYYPQNSAWESMQLWGAYNGNFGLNLTEGKKTNGVYNIDYINLGIDGKLKNNTVDYRLMLNVAPMSSRNFSQMLFADVYVATNKIPHHRVTLGNTRPPVGMEGGYSPFLLPYIARAQISRNFGSVRKLGARISGNYSLVDYDLGLYSSDTYFQEIFPGTEFVGWINFKPLGKTDGKYGKIKIGTGLQNGNRNCDYTVTGAYLGYEYKKLWLNFEWANANGYNGPIGYAVNKKADGFYSTIAYKFTPKLQGLIRYDEFDPNKKIASNKQREYSAGINYFIKGQALKLIVNYIYCQNQATKDSHRIMLGTQLLL